MMHFVSGNVLCHIVHKQSFTEEHPELRRRTPIWPADNKIHHKAKRQDAESQRGKPIRNLQVSWLEVNIMDSKLCSTPFVIHNRWIAKCMVWGPDCFKLVSNFFCWRFLINKFLTPSVIAKTLRMLGMCPDLPDLLRIPPASKTPGALQNLGRKCLASRNDLHNLKWGAPLMDS